MVIRIMRALILGLATTVIAATAEDVRPLLMGQSIPNVGLKTKQGEDFDLRAAAQKQPLIIIFYRGGWCPYCNKHLGQLQQADSQLRELGYRIVAISPDRPEKLKESIDKGELSYTLLSDSHVYLGLLVERSRLL